MINGANNICVFLAEGKGLNVKIDKGSQFLFFKLAAQDLSLSDVTGYPYTTTKPLKLVELYPLLCRKKNPQAK